MSVKVPGGHCLLAGLSCNSIIYAELASLDSVCKKVYHSAVAWFTFVCLVEAPDAIMACGTLAGGESGNT